MSGSLRSRKESAKLLHNSVLKLCLILISKQSVNHFKLNHKVYPVTKLSTRNNNNKVATTPLLGKSEVLAKVATHQVSS